VHTIQIDSVLHNIFLIIVLVLLRSKLFTPLGSSTRTDPRLVLSEWLLRPCFQRWLRRRYQAMLWILANMVYYLVHKRRTISFWDYTDFMPRMRWKTYQEINRMKLVGNYLEVF